MSAPDWFESCGPDSFPEPVRAAAQPVASIGSHRPFELAAKALYSNWTPEKVNHLIATADDYVAQHAASVHDLEMQKYIGARLRRVAKAAGVTVDYGDDEFYYAGAFSILGDIARVLEKTAASVQVDIGLSKLVIEEKNRIIEQANARIAKLEAAAAQPDSGRDAVAMRWPNGRGQYYYADMGDTVTEAVLDLPELEYLYLAAHPANVAQPVGNVSEEEGCVFLSAKAVKAMAATYHSSVGVFISEARRLGGLVNYANVAQPVSDAALEDQSFAWMAAEQLKGRAISDTLRKAYLEGLAANVAQPVSDAARDYNDKLRQEVSMMFQMLDAGEWAEHVAVTSHGQCLETAITRLVSRANVAQVGELSDDELADAYQMAQDVRDTWYDPHSANPPMRSARAVFARALLDILDAAKKGA